MAQQAHGRDDGTAATGPVRAARRGRLGLGVGQGGRLARLHHHDPGLPAGPRLLLHGRQDDRPRGHRSGRPSTSARRRTPRCRARRRWAPSSRGRPRRRSSRCPRPRTDGSIIQVGTKLLYIGGSDGQTAKADVYVANVVGTGNFDKWEKGPSLPAPRADASVAYVAGKIYLDRRDGRRRQPHHDDLRADPDERRPRRVGGGHREPGAPGATHSARPRSRSPTASCSSAARMRPVRSRRPGRRCSTRTASSGNGSPRPTS